MEDIINVDPERLETIKDKIRRDGNKGLHVISDFDATLSKAFTEQGKAHSSFAQIRNNGLLGEDYIKKTFELHDIYQPIEIDPHLSREEKIPKMQEWWEKHLNLLKENRFSKDTVKQAVMNWKDLRPGCEKFLSILNDNDIPLVIMSSGLGDMIKEVLKQKDLMSENVFIIANIFEFDGKGDAIDYRKPVIHSMNKHETSIKNFPAYEKIKNRKNIILLGDVVEDIGMVEGLNYDNIIRIGFLNERTDERLESFKQNFDIIILNDSDMDIVNMLLEEILS